MSDVTKIGRYSPETFEADGSNAATGPAVGAQFRGHVKRNGKGPIYWTTCTVIGQRARPRVRLRGGQRRQRRSTSGATGSSRPATAPTSPSRSRSPTTLGLRLYWALLGWARGKTNRNGMRTTLERIKAEVEQRPEG